MSMRNRLAGVGIAGLLCCPLSFAQESLLGTYSGSIEIMPQSGRSFNAPLKLVITGAENGKLSGKFWQGAGGCNGDFPFGGTYEGTALVVKLDESVKQGCGTNPMNLNLQGGKLVGKWGIYELNLSK